MSSKIIKRDSFKRGETACFVYEFLQPYAGWDWSIVTLDAALTAQTEPSSNDSAVAVRTNQSLTVDASNKATYAFQLTPTESEALVPGTTYHDACQLKQSSSFVAKPVTGRVVIEQDYIV